MRPDGRALSGVALPSTCSPKEFTGAGEVLVCIDLSDDGDLDDWQYAVEHKGSSWRRVPLPPELHFPDWADPINQDDVDAPQWSPGRDRIAFIRPADDGGTYWFSSTGDVVVADSSGSGRRVVAFDGEAPKFSPDGKRVAFSRCRVDEDGWRNGESEREAECSLWTTSADERQSPKLLAKHADSVAFWSPDGRFIAFLRQATDCLALCRYRIVLVPSAGGEPVEVGPDLVGPRPALAWLLDAPPSSFETATSDGPHLQRCVDIWNRARMHPWPTGAVNVSLVGDRCQVTVSDYGAICEQSVQMPFRFWCPSHGGGLDLLPPASRVWNGHGSEDGKISLFSPLTGPHLPLPKAPSYPLLDGFVGPYDKKGERLRALKVRDVRGGCEWFEEMSKDRVADEYPLRCGWGDSGSDSCFKRPGELSVGDFVLCPDYWYDRRYDPLSFVRVEVTSTE